WSFTGCSSASFSFQAEDGIRAGHVTGVQTCALPISRGGPRERAPHGDVCGAPRVRKIRRTPQRGARQISGEEAAFRYGGSGGRRSEERRVGKECRSRWARASANEIYRGRQRGVWRQR